MLLYNLHEPAIIMTAKWRLDAFNACVVFFITLLKSAESRAVCALFALFIFHGL